MPIRQDTLRRRWFAATNYAPSTVKTYTETLNDFERRFPIYAERVRLEHLTDYLTTDADGSDTSRSPNTLNRQRAVLRVFWRWVHRQGYVKADPSDGIGDIFLGQGEQRPGRWLTRDEARRLLESCEAGDQGQRDRTLMLVALLTGLRRSELVQLTWRNVDLAQRRITVRGKGGKVATIGLPEQASAGLTDWRAVLADRQGRRSPGPDQPVFPTGRKHGGLNNSTEDYVFDFGRPLTPWTVRKIIARRAEAAGLGTVATHDLRRSFAGFLDEDGADLKGIQAALRHRSPDVTARCYLDRSPRRAIEAVAGLRL